MEVDVRVVMGSTVSVVHSVLADFEDGDFRCGEAANLTDESLWEIGVKMRIGDLGVETENRGDMDFIVTVKIVCWLPEIEFQPPAGM